jgi:hypothetical protein
MLRVSIHSRRGNAVLGFLGVVYAIAAVVLLAWHLAQTWGAAGTIDRAIQVILVGTLLMGVWFVRIAIANLGMHVRSGDPRTESKPATV